MTDPVDIALLIVVVALALYCAFLSRSYARLSSRFEELSRQAANHAEKGNRE